MSQILSKVTQDPPRRESPVCESAMRDYDDGNPATVSQASQEPAPAYRIGFGHRTERRNLLATTARDAMVEYDDGDPATVLV